MATYLVTGGAGYIGSHVVSRLLADGYQVRILDDLSSGRRERVPMGVELVEGDIRRAVDVDRALAGVEGVFHLAAIPRVPYSVQYPAETLDVNVQGTVTLLEGMRRHGVRRIVFSSSSSVYGNAQVVPTDEAQPIRPLNPYALSKYVVERILEQYVDLYGLEAVSLRYFNVYGSGMREDAAYATVVAAFLGCRRRHEPLTIHGTGEQRRDFVHVEDVVRANLLAMASARVGKGEVMNIGSGTVVSVQEIAARLKGPEGITHLDGRRGDATHTQADNRRAKALLGWEPSISFAEGIARALAAELDLSVPA